MVKDRASMLRWEEHSRGIVYRSEWKYELMAKHAAAGFWWMVPAADWNGLVASWVPRTEQWLFKHLG